MKAREELEQQLAELEEDERLTVYKAATVLVNAPLALIQVDLFAKANTLRWVLGLPRRRYHGDD